jgi:hypothetical protein
MTGDRSVERDKTERDKAEKSSKCMQGKTGSVNVND